MIQKNMNCLRRSLLVLITLLFPFLVKAQLTSPGGGTSSLPIPTLGQPSLEKSVITPSPDALIFDGAVDPAEYRLGPGDILSYRSWNNNETANLMVSADMFLVVPRIGEFSVKGKTFDQVKQEIREYSSKQFKKTESDPRRSELSLTIAQPRRIAVSVLGEVETPGIYTFTAATRADIAIKIADKPAQRQAIIADEARQIEIEKRKREADRIKPYLGNEDNQSRSLRYIAVRHSDGTSDRVDLVRFNATRDPRFCPLLREGDVIYVPFRKQLEGSVAVYGAVNAPQDYEFVEGDSLWTLIQASFGPTQGADLGKVELSRMVDDGTSFETRIIDALAIKEKRAEDIPLIAGDRIFVREKPDLRELSRVIVKGEVMRPGVYPINRVKTKLSDVISLAGGFTQYAFKAGGTVIRKKLDIDNKDITTEEEAKLVGRVANLSVEDTANFRFQTEVRTGYVAVDMAKLFDKGDKSQDIELRDGDIISIPVAPTTVYVWGYVGSVGHIPYHPGADADFYIQSAGGYAEGAVESGTRVIKARTRKWVEPDETTVEPGDEIFVPQEGMYTEDYTLRIVSLVVGMIGTIVYATSIVIALTN
jgi:protein involved in polysaccharide export with SLBB domain